MILTSNEAITMRKQLREKLCMTSMLSAVKKLFEQLPTPKNARIKTADCLMSGLAVYGLKAPSLLKFGERMQDETCKTNVKNLYQIEEIPSDTSLRERLDVIAPKYIRPAFKALFAIAQRGKVIEQFRYLDDAYLVSVDGSGYYSSHTVHCNACCVKNHRNGAQTFYHQALCAVLVHPDIKHVVPFMPEFISKEDGDKKNDCERNASKRLLSDLRREHPHLKIIIVEDGLASNGPHLQHLDSLNMRYIIGAQESDHAYLFDWVKDIPKETQVIVEEGVTHTFSYVNGVPLNATYPDYLVNFLHYTQTDKKGRKTTWTWVTNIQITQDNCFKIMKGGRARWHIENQTFNTLKNQGYNFEHNFGHGYAHLSHIMATLMMLIFMIDQLQMLACPVFKAAKKRLGSYMSLWEEMRVVVRYIVFETWDQLFHRITYNPP